MQAVKKQTSARTSESALRTARPERIKFLDFVRSASMLFVFYHHISQALPNPQDHFRQFNPFAEFFVILSGLMVGLVYLHRDSLHAIRKRTIQIFGTYYGLALPIAAGAAYFGAFHEEMPAAIFETLTLQRDQTWVGVLRFYGIMFLLLPILLPAYKKQPRIIVYGSAAIFVCFTLAHHSGATMGGSFFWNNVVISQFQWQFFFVIGIAMGDMLKQSQFSTMHFQYSLATIGICALLIDLFFQVPTDGSKWPYTFEKYINFLWTGPLCLLLIYRIHPFIEKTSVYKYIINIGKNSLSSFALSEVFLQSIKFGVVLFAAQPDPLTQQIIGLIATITIPLIMWKMKGQQ